MSEERSVLVGMPKDYQEGMFKEHFHRLFDAHPNVRVTVTDSPVEFANLLTSADGVVFHPAFKFPPVALSNSSQLQWIHSLPAGADHWLTPELAAAEHITITATKGPMAPLMAEHAVMLMLALARRLPEYLKDQEKHEWNRMGGNLRSTTQMLGNTICVLGVGRTGGIIARVCKVGFGMRILGMSRTNRDHPHVDRYFDRDQLHEAIGESDFVVLTMALTPATTKIMNKEALAAMKSTAYLINVARAGLVEQDALIDALRSGIIAGAGLDDVIGGSVTEPLPEDDPLWDVPNLIITPHISAGSERFGEYMIDFWCANIRHFAEGEPLEGVVNRHEKY
jgi:D-2-hydroxyacid dehydrogenase (NADP+)